MSHNISLKYCLVILFLLMMAGVASATDYYVATWGNNSNDGLTVDTPKLNWSSTWFNSTNIKAGDTIYLINGTWIGETILVASSGNSTHPIKITSYNGTPTIDTNNVFNLIGININSRNYTIISNITFKNSTNGSSRPIEITTGHDNTISNITCNTCAQLTISQGYSWNNSISDSVFSNGVWNMVQVTSENTGTGTGRYTNNITIKNNRFNSQFVYHVGAVDLFGNLEGVLIENNTFILANNTGIYGHSVPDRRYNITIRNNTFSDGTQIAIKTGAEENLIIDNNTFNNITTQYPITLGYNDVNVTIKNNSFYNISLSVINVYDSELVLLDSNYIDSTATKYSVQTNASNVTVRNPLGLKVIWLINSWLNKSVQVEYLDGTVFSYSKVGTANISDIGYYSDKSNMSISSTSSTTTIIPYNITLRPSQNHVTASNTSTVVLINATSQAFGVLNITIGSDVSAKSFNLSGLVNTTGTYNLAYSNGTLIQSVVAVGGIANFTSQTNGSYQITDETVSVASATSWAWSSWNVSESNTPNDWATWSSVMSVAVLMSIIAFGLLFITASRDGMDISDMWGGFIAACIVVTVIVIIFAIVPGIGYSINSIFASYNP